MRKVKKVGVLVDSESIPAEWMGTDSDWDQLPPDKTD